MSAVITPDGNGVRPVAAALGEGPLVDGFKKGEP